MRKIYIKLFVFVSVLALMSVVYTLLSHKESSPVLRSKMLAPANDVPKTMIITKDNRNTYYQIGRDESLRYKVVGPGNLRVITRFDFDNEGIDPDFYRVVIQSDEDSPFRVARSISRSNVSTYEVPNGHTPATIRSIYLNIPSGVHWVSASLPEDADYRVNFKFIMEVHKTEKGSWIATEPEYFLKNEILNIKGSDRMYYPATESEGLVFSLTGPAQLRLKTRWMSIERPADNSVYEVIVKENGVDKFSKKLSSGYSSNVVLKKTKEKKRFAGKARTLYIRVPSGDHTYDVAVKYSKEIDCVLVRPFVLRGGTPQQVSKVTLRSE